MKLTITIEVILLCIILSIFCIFTVDAVSVRKAELLSILSVDVENIVEDFFEEEIDLGDLPRALQTAVETSLNSESSNINVVIRYANAEQGIADVLIEVTYIQPTGRPRLLSYERVYIVERPNESSEAQYSFIRTIDAEYYKDADTILFVAENDGGLKEDSIWRTKDYEQVLDFVLLAPEVEG